MPIKIFEPGGPAFLLSLIRGRPPDQPQTVAIQGQADLADYLHDTRLSRGITPTELSRQTSISRENVYRIERGENITLETLFAYCGAVGVAIRLEIADQEETV